VSTIDTIHEPHDTLRMTLSTRQVGAIALAAWCFGSLTTLAAQNAA